MELETILPIKTVSEANRRDHWTKKHKRAKAQRGAAFMYCRIVFGHSPLSTIDNNQPVTVELTRCATRKLDRDNLYSSVKHIVDGVCDWLGIDDGDKLFNLNCYQEFKSKSNELKLKIIIAD
jgi:hypothetical protein